MKNHPTQPALFLGHGAPTLALDAAKGAPLATLGAQMGRPKALLVVSAHWEDAPVTIGATRTLPLLYDFYGFPRPLYEVEYAAPGAPELGEEIAKRLSSMQVARDETRGLDHGVWTPLVHMFPDADIPVLQLSMPSELGAQAIFEVGQALSELRDAGVALLGSGNMTHNLRAIRPDGSAPAAWATEFEDWARDALIRGDVDALMAYRERSPAFARNHPTEDHWLPLFFALGAGHTAGTPSFPVEGFEYGNLSRMSVRFG